MVYGEGFRTPDSASIKTHSIKTHVEEVI